VEQFKRDPLAHLKVPELSLEIRLMEKHITAGGADDAAALPASESFDAPFRDLASVDRLRRADMRRRRHRTPFQESGLPKPKAAHCSFRKLTGRLTGQSLTRGGPSTLHLLCATGSQSCLVQRDPRDSNPRSDASIRKGRFESL